VEHATVERLLPNHLRVKIAERTPIAFAQNGDRVLLIDRHGALLDLPAGADAARLSFPVLDGMGQDVPLGVRQARMGLYLAFIRELDSHGEKVSARLSEVDLSDPDDTIGIFDENGSAIALHFGDHNFFERYQIYQTHLAEWQQQYPRLAKVDLRNAPQIVLGMAAGAPPPTSAAAGSAPAPQPSPATTPVSASDASTSNASASNPSASNVPAQPSLATTQPNSKPSAAGTQPAAAAHKAAAPKTAAKPNQKPSPKPVAKHPKPAAKADSKTAARPVAKSAAKPAARLTPAQQVFKNQPPRAPSALPALRLAQHPAALPKPIANQEGPQ
jgi:cell division protein FtsQ